MSGRKNLASKYLEAIGSPESLESPPLRPSRNRGNVSPLKRSPTKEHLTDSFKENNLPPESPVKRLIKQKEKDTIDNHASGFIPVPDHQYSPVKFGGFSRRQKDRRPSPQEIRTMGQISRAISNSPSLKNLNKLRAIENRLTSGTTNNNTNKRSVSGLQHKLKFNNRDGAGAGGGVSASTRPRVVSSSGNAKLDFVCRLLEVEEWISRVLGEPLQVDESNIAEFQDYFRNGVLLAEVVKTMDPSAISHIYYGQGVDATSPERFTNKKGLYFKFTENIVQFLNYLKKVQLPDMFVFETRDLFEMKNFPKVIFCLQALSYMSAMQGTSPALRKISYRNVNIAPAQLKKVEQQIRGLRLPNFDNIYDGVRVNIGSDICPVSLIEEETEPEPEPEPKTEPEPAVVSDTEEDAFTSTLDLPKTRSVAQYDNYDNYLHNPSMKQEDTKDARTLFRDFNPALDIDMEAIEKKYAELMKKDDEDLLSSTNAGPKTVNSDGIPEDDVIALQALARGALVRYSLFVNKFMFKVFTPDIVQFQSIIRGSLVRKRLSLAKARLNANSRELTVLKNLAKLRQKDENTKEELSKCNDEVLALQCFIRGGQVREKNYRTRKQLLLQTSSIIRLQSMVRGNRFRDLLEKEGADAIHEHKIARSTRLERKRKRPLPKLPTEKHQTHNEWLANRVSENEGTFNSLAAQCRGFLVRQEMSQKKRDLQKQVTQVIAVQSYFRGSLARFYADVKHWDLQDNVSTVCDLQARIRGVLLRDELKRRDDWFHRPENVAKIVRIQNIFRATLAASDYKQLITEKNPPLKAVRNYISLLSGSDVNVEDEVNIEKYKQKIAAETKRIESREQELKQLGVKLQLLKKNKVSLEEIVKFKEDTMNLSEYSQNLNEIMSQSLSSNPNKMVDKSTKNLLELYDKIFYLLQTHPYYFATLLYSMDSDHELEQCCDGDTTDMILRVFNYSVLSADNTTKPTREEFLLMKVVLEGAKQFFKEMKSGSEFHEYLRGSQTEDFDVKHWEILLSGYINLPQQRLLAKNLFSSAILRVTSDSDAWFESDPSKIYQYLLSQSEDEGRIMIKSLNENDPIEDPDTRVQFVKNLSELREVSYDVMKSIGDSVEHVPLFIRSLCREVYRDLKKQFPGESEKYYLSAVGSLFMRNYVLPLFTKPENYSINVVGLSDDVDTAERIMTNLNQVAKVLGQLAALRPFSGLEAYLQPINPFLEEFSEGMREYIRDLIDVPAMDQSYQMSSVYDDVASHEKPILSMNADDVLGFLEFIRENVNFVAPDCNDYLRYLLLAADELSSNHRKLITGKDDMLELELEPVTESTDTKELEAKTLIMEAKRYIVYILQVQDGDDLLDLLLSEITPRDELKFKEIVKREKESESGSAEAEGIDSVFERQALNDIYNSTYPQVKKHAIEMVLELEKKGIVTRTDGYQMLVNELADDIKNKQNQKQDRDRRLKVVVETLTRLTEKEKTCTKLYNEYIRDIDRGMLKLQNHSVQKKKPLLSRFFSKQYYYQLKLKHKTGYVPRFGSFKYNGKQLEDRGILQKIAGDIRPNRVNFVFSSDKQGEFMVDVSNNSADISGVETLTLDKLLEMQYENKKEFTLFEKCATFNTDKFVAFIFHKFYEVKKE